MALTPTMNDDQLDIFRSKLCQRLSRDGLCQWKSKCQYSHCLEWPRRPPRKHRYTPSICPNLRVMSLDKNGAFGVTNKCEAGRLCRYAHSSEEVLYHPLIYKTTMCEEWLQQNAQRNGRNGFGGKKRCQQYYCPYAHGEDELRTSAIPADHIKMYLSALQAFTAGDASKVSMPSIPPMDAPSNPQEGNMIGAKTAPVEDTYTNSKQEDPSMIWGKPPLLATSPQMQLWADQSLWTNPKLGIPPLSQNHTDSIVAIKPKSCLVSPTPPGLTSSQCNALADRHQWNQENGWPHNLLQPRKIPSESSTTLLDSKQSSTVDDDEDDSDQIFADLQASVSDYMFKIL